MKIEKNPDFDQFWSVIFTPNVSKGFSFLSVRYRRKHAVPVAIPDGAAARPEGLSSLH